MPAVRVSEPEKLRRRHLLDALREIGTPAVGPTLLEIAKNPSDPLRAKAVQLLAELQYPDCADALFHLTTSTDDETRCEAALALGKHGDERATDLLLPLLDNGDWQIRAVEALGHMRDPSAVGPLLDLLAEATELPRTQEKEVPLGGQPMDRHDHHLRQVAIKALGLIGDHAATEPLLQQLERAGNADPHSIIWDLERALVAIGDERAIEPLLAPWKKGEQKRLDSQFAGDFQGTRMLDAIAAVMLDSAYDAQTRAHAADRLTYAGREESLTAFRKALKDPDAEVRESACRGMWCIQNTMDEAMIFDPDLTTSIGSFLLEQRISSGRYPNDADEAVRYLVLDGVRSDLIALWPRTKRLLFADLRSDSPKRQLYAARCLIRIGYGNETVPELVAALESSKNERMALDFFHSSNERLRKAAVAWSEKTGKGLDGQQTPTVNWAAMKKK